MAEPAPQLLDLSLVVPVYNEEGNIRPFLERVEKVFARLGVSYEIIFCLDPCPDDTERVILAEIERNPAIKLLVFSRRFGQPAATMAGILSCGGRVCGVIDVDLQDPPEVIEELFAKIREGYEVAYARRRSREGETALKMLIAKVGYWLINRITDIRIPRDTGDFRLLSRRVIEELRRLNENHGFLRGYVASVGFKQAEVLYDRDPRACGKGNYNRFTGSLKIGLNGIIAYSNLPLQWLWMGGGAICLLTLAALVWFLVQWTFGFTLLAWPGLWTLALFFLGGAQLLGLGVMGEYVGRIYDQVKGRPQYIVDRRVGLDPRKP